MIYLVNRPRVGRSVWLALGLIMLANLPDIDLLPGYLVGEPRAFHWGPAHSFAAALLVGSGAGLAGRRWGAAFLPFFTLATAAFGTHLLLDWLLGPGSQSGGLQLLWPVDAERFIAPWHVFHMFPTSVDHLSPVRALFTRDVLPLMLRELAILGPMCLAAWLVGRRKPQSAPRSASRRSHRPPDTVEGEVS